MVDSLNVKTKQYEFVLIYIVGENPTPPTPYIVLYKTMKYNVVRICRIVWSF